MNENQTDKAKLPALDVGVYVCVCVCVSCAVRPFPDQIRTTLPASVVSSTAVIPSTTALSGGRLAAVLCLCSTSRGFMTQLGSLMLRLLTSICDLGTIGNSNCRWLRLICRAMLICAATAISSGREEGGIY